MIPAPRIRGARIASTAGGKDMKYTAAVITISDKGSRGERVDTSGPALCAIAEEHGLEVVYTSIIPDESEQIKAELTRCADEVKASLILTTGGTGFSPRDVTPEATYAVIERETPGIPEAMRAESMKITNRGCLSRSAAGIRGGSLIVNLPGSEKAARENLLSVIDAVQHGLDMLKSSGSADCAVPAAPDCGMYLFHNGVVRETAKARVRAGNQDAKTVKGLTFSYDAEKVSAAVEETRKLPGIFYVRVWLNEGDLDVGDDIRLVLIGGDIRPRVVDALTSLVGTIKNECVVETERY